MTSTRLLLFSHPRHWREARQQPHGLVWHPPTQPPLQKNCSPTIACTRLRSSCLQSAGNAWMGLGTYRPMKVVLVGWASLRMTDLLWMIFFGLWA